MSEEASQIAEETRKVPRKEERERYTHLNSEFQRIARGDKEACLKQQCNKREKK